MHRTRRAEVDPEDPTGRSTFDQPGSADSSVPAPEGPNHVAAVVHVSWLLFRLTVWATVLVFLSPRLLSKLGWHAGSTWLLEHLWVRLLAIPVLLPLFLFSAFNIRSVEPVSDDAAGPEPSNGASPGFDLTLGIREGPVSRWPLQRHVVEAATWARGPERSCVATASVNVTSALAFSIRPARQEPTWMRGLAQQVIRDQLARGKRSAGASDASAWDAASHLGQDPVDLSGSPLDGEVLLRTDRPNLGRELLSDPEVARVLRDLLATDRRWEWTLCPSGRSGGAQLKFECRGSLENAELAAWAQALMGAALRRLALSEAIAEPENAARRSA